MMQAGLAHSPADSVAGLPTADFDFESMLDAGEQAKLAELRVFLTREVAPFAGEWWNKAEFPAHPAQARGPGAQRPGPARLQQPVRRSGHCRDDRVDTSLATFFLVHHDLFVESLYGFQLRGAEATPARGRRQPPDHRRVRPDRTGAWLRRGRRHGDRLAASVYPAGARRRGHLGAQRRQALDRQRDVLRLHARVGP